MRHYEFEINLQIDGELGNEEQIELYNHLSICQECRDNFNKYNQLRRETKPIYNKNIANVLLNLNEDELIGTRDAGKVDSSKKFYKIGFYISAAAAIILLFFLTSSKSKETFVTKNEVRIDTIFVKKEIPITQNKTVRAYSITPGKRSVFVESSQKAYLQYVMSLRSITFDDGNEKNNNRSNL